ncbi:MAG: hypothetical protein HY314_05660 [Acidobacteria bacterium]|nr:hypothetical protein [Acidobacteriota bacterium]
MMKQIRISYVLFTLLAGACLGLLADAGNLALTEQVGAWAAPSQETKYAVRDYQMRDTLVTTESAGEPESPANTAQTTTLIIDDGSFEHFVGLLQPGTIYFVNRLRPPSYPATLSQLQIFFGSGNSNLTPGSAITLLIGSNPDGDENVDGTSFQQVGASIQALDQFNTYGVPSLTINSGDFVVGFRMTIPGNVFPGALDDNSPSHRRSYLSTDGVNFDLTEDRGDVPDGNFGIRAVVNLAQPILSVSPTSLVFNTVVGQTTPPGQTFTVSNVGTGTLNYSISISDPSLVNISPSAGTLGPGQSHTVSVFVTPPTVAGTRQAFLSINAPGAQNSPQTVTVTVNTTNPPGILSVSPTSLTFNAIIGQGNPPPQSIIVQNTGSGPFSFTITSNSGSVFVSPSSGTLGPGQSQSVQVSVINPNSPGTITAQLTVSAAGAQNSPQFVNVTIITQQGGPVDENEPNDNPQSARIIPNLFPGQSITINGDARPGDTGTEIDQIMTECQRDRLIQDWFRLNVSQRDSFRTVLSFQRDAADFDLFVFIQTNDFAQFPEGVQLIASSAQGPGQAEAFNPRVLEPGTYFIAVSRVRRNNFSDFNRVSYTLTVTRGSSPEIHAIEDVACVGFVTTEQFRNGHFVVNRVRPTRHPARLEAISILFSSPQGQPSPNGRPVRIIAFTDPSGSGFPPFNPPLLVNQTVIINLPAGGQGAFSTLNLGASGPIINQGDFYVGYVIDTFNGIFLNLGRVIYPNIHSFFSNNNGQSYQQLTVQDNMGRQFNAAIRGIVNTTPFSSEKQSAEGMEDLQTLKEIEVIPLDLP